MKSRFLLTSLVAVGISSLSFNALAQDAAPPSEAPSAPASATPSGSPPSTPATDPASPSTNDPYAKKLHASVAIERVGGFSYSNVSSKDSSGSLSAAGYVIGGPSVNPDTSPRLGVDAIFGSNLTLGAGLAGGTYSLRSSPGDGGRSSTNTLSLFILAPRIGYRIPLSKNWDLTPRAVVTIQGGSLETNDDKNKDSVIALGLGGEGLLAYRATSSLNLLAGLSFDHTVAASTSSRSTSTGLQSGSTSTSSSSQEVNGSLFTMQLWIGIGGYL